MRDTITGTKSAARKGDSQRMLNNCLPLALEQGSVAHAEILNAAESDENL